jgi:hypothetical protein
MPDREKGTVDNSTLEYLASSFNRYSLQSYIRAVAAKGDLRVTFSEQAKRVDFSKKGEIVVPELGSNYDVNAITKILRIIDAAASTYRYGVDGDFLRQKGMTVPDSLLSMAVNALERDRCDFLSSREFSGDAHILDGYYQLTDCFLPNIEALTEKTNNAEDKDTKTAIDVVSALQMLDAKLKSDYIVSADEMYNKMKRVATKRAAELSERLYDFIGEEHRNNYLNSRNPTQVSYDIAKKIFKESTGESPEEEEQACQQQQQQNSESGESESQCFGNNERAKESGEGDGDKDDSKPEVPPPMAQFNEKRSREFEGLDSGGSGHGFTYGDFSEYASSRDFIVADEKDLIIVDFPQKKIHTNNGLASGFSRAYFNDKAYNNDYRKEVDRMSCGRGLANSVRRVLEINSKSRYNYGKKKGKLHSANLYRVTMKDAKGFNERVFKDKEEKFNLDVCVSLLVDYSGSMSGIKLEHAIQAAYLLQDAIGRSLRIPVEVLGFTDNGCDASTLLIFKGFDTRVSPETLKGYMCAGGENTCQNADGEAIAWAHKRIVNRKEKRKIQVVFSDGSPACGRRGVVGYTGEVVSDIENKSPVEIYGIGIMDGSVERFYKRNQVINEPEELEPALLNLIKRSIIR